MLAVIAEKVPTPSDQSNLRLLHKKKHCMLNNIIWRNTAFLIIQYTFDLLTHPISIAGIKLRPAAKRNVNPENQEMVAA